MVFREMRRSRQLMSAEDTIAVLNRGSNGVLACLGDEDYPYAVPLNYVYHNGRIYFHSANAGHKMDAMAKHPKVSFTVVDEDTILSERYTSCFRSAILFGKARIVEGDERLEAFRALVEKYSGNQPEEIKQKVVEKCIKACIVAIDIEHMTGKEAKEFIEAKRQSS